MTPAQVLSTIRNAVYETSPNFWSDAEIYQLMWEAEMWISKDIEGLQYTNSATTTVVGTQEYTVPTGVYIIQRLQWGKQKLKRIDLQDQDAIDGTLKDSTIRQGQTTHYWQWGTTIGLYPVPDEALTLKYYYNGEPTQIDQASTAFSVPLIFHANIKNFVLSELYAKKGEDNEGKANWYLQNWERNFSKDKKVWRRSRKADKYSVVKEEGVYQTTEWGIR